MEPSLLDALASAWRDLASSASAALEAAASPPSPGRPLVELDAIRRGPLVPAPYAPGERPWSDLCVGCCAVGVAGAWQAGGVPPGVACLVGAEALAHAALRAQGTRLADVGVTPMAVKESVEALLWMLWPAGGAVRGALRVAGGGAAAGGGSDGASLSASVSSALASLASSVVELPLSLLGGGGGGGDGAAGGAAGAFAPASLSPASAQGLSPTWSSWASRRPPASPRYLARCLFAPFVHPSLPQLAANLAALVAEGGPLEVRFGWRAFLGLCLGLSVASQAALVALTCGVGTALDAPRGFVAVRDSPLALGLSGVVVGLQVVRGYLFEADLDEAREAWAAEGRASRQRDAWGAGGRRGGRRDDWGAEGRGAGLRDRGEDRWAGSAADPRSDVAWGIPVGAADATTTLPSLGGSYFARRSPSPTSPPALSSPSQPPLKPTSRYAAWISAAVASALAPGGAGAPAVAGVWGGVAAVYLAVGAHRLAAAWRRRVAERRARGGARGLASGLAAALGMVRDAAVAGAGAAWGALAALAAATANVAASVYRRSPTAQRLARAWRGSLAAKREALAARLADLRSLAAARLAALRARLLAALEATALGAAAARLLAAARDVGRAALLSTLRCARVAAGALLAQLGALAAHLAATVVAAVRSSPTLSALFGSPPPSPSSSASPPPSSSSAVSTLSSHSRALASRLGVAARATGVPGPWQDPGPGGADSPPRPAEPDARSRSVWRVGAARGQAAATTRARARPRVSLGAALDRNAAIGLPDLVAHGFICAAVVAALAWSEEQMGVVGGGVWAARR